MRTLAIALFAAVGALQAQTPVLTNAKMETRAVSGDPVRFLHSLESAENGPMWFGYSIVSQDQHGTSCCWNNDQCGCRLEGGNGGVTINGTQSPLKLEGSKTLFILYRVENHAVGKIHPVSENCPLDGGGLRFVWLTGVPSDASVRFLSDLVESNGLSHEHDTPIFAISAHAGPAADAALEKFAAPPTDEHLREKALFWLASSRGARGLAVVRNAAEHDPSDHIREKIMFDLTLTSDPAGIDDLIHFAKQDPSPRVRGQALFWLGQKAGKKSESAITDAIVNDPDTEVKKKAVFALQNLPKDQGVPLLIQVAKTNRNPEVRKQAMFWLGQSGDPRALAFFQEVLSR